MKMGKKRQKSISIQDILNTMDSLNQDHSIPEKHHSDLRKRLRLAFDGTGPTVKEPHSRTSGIEAYSIARAASSFIFLAFVIRMSPRGCRYYPAKVSEFTKYSTALRQKFSLDKTTIEMLEQWAYIDNYGSKREFIGFITDVSKETCDVSPRTSKNTLPQQCKPSLSLLNHAKLNDL
jgi:hypothetical protein